MTDYVKINGVWHIKDADTKISVRTFVTLHCTGTRAFGGYPQSVGEKGDDAPLCDKCVNNPLPDELKAKLQKRQ